MKILGSKFNKLSPRVPQFVDDGSLDIAANVSFVLWDAVKHTSYSASLNFSGDLLHSIFYLSGILMRDVSRGEASSEFVSDYDDSLELTSYCSSSSSSLSLDMLS